LKSWHQFADTAAKLQSDLKSTTHIMSMRGDGGLGGGRGSGFAAHACVHARCLALSWHQQSHTAARAINASGDANAFIH
jgi:hypothetical protein